MKRREVLGLAVSTGAVLTGCLGGGDGGDGGCVVSVMDMGFTPRNLSVEAGTTVTWVNENMTIVPEHTVTSEPILECSDEWSFDAELPEEGDEATHTFESDGLYTYVDRYDDDHCGLVAVGDASYGKPLPCAPAGGGGTDC